MIFKTKRKEQSNNIIHFTIIGDKEQIQSPPMIQENELYSKMDTSYNESNVKEFLTLYKVWSDYYCCGDIVTYTSWKTDGANNTTNKNRYV